MNNFKELRIQGYEALFLFRKLDMNLLFLHPSVFQTKYSLSTIYQ